MIEHTETRQTIVGFLSRYLHDFSDAPAIWVDKQTCLSYGQLFTLIGQFVSTFQDISLSRNARIAFITPKGAPALVGFLGASAVSTCCPLDGKLKTPELESAFAALDPDVVLVGESTSPAFEVAQRIGIPAILSQIDFQSLHCSFSVSINASRNRDAQRLDLLLNDGDAPAILMRTSGTTALPKIVGLSHGNVLSATETMRVAFKLTHEDVCVTPMPLHHVHGLIAASLSALAVGSSIHLCEVFSPEVFDASLENFSPTWITASPALYLATRDYFEAAGKKPNTARLRCFRSSSAPLAASAIHSLEALFSAPLIETYGLTETASTICSNLLPPGQRKVGSVGVALHADLKIVDDNDAELPVGEPGEIVLKGPGVISRYLGPQPLDAFYGDFLRTGDIGHLDPDGYLYVVGRKKELIKRGGHSVFPGEIDDAICTFPGIAEVATFSIPHDTLGEDLVAAVVVKADQDVDLNALRSWLSRRLSSYKIPTRLLRITQIPRNSIGKVVRRDLPKFLASYLAPECIPAQNTTESALLDIWQRILHRNDIGTTDNLFQFGADSLRAESASKTIYKALNIHCDVSALYSNPTVREQARLCAESRGQQ